MAQRPESEYVRVNVRITKRQLEWLKKRSEQVGQNYNWVIRWAISELIGRVDKDTAEAPNVPRD